MAGNEEVPADTNEAIEGTENPPDEEPTSAQVPRSEQEYRIQAGDTLGAIAVKYGVTVDEIMRANDLTDPDRLVVGVVLIIPGETEELPTRQPHRRRRLPHRQQLKAKRRHKNRVKHPHPPAGRLQ